MKRFKSPIAGPLLIVCLMGICVSANNGMNSREATIAVSVTCSENINKINADGAELYEYLVGACRGAAEHNDPTFKPSTMLNFFATKYEDLDSELPLRYASATNYIRHCILPLSNELDKEFDAHYQETKDVGKTWQWLEEYMKQRAIVEPFTTLKRQLIEADQQKRRFAEKGIFVHENTLIIDPSLRT